jgi:hypothetical protein
MAGVAVRGTSEALLQPNSRGIVEYISLDNFHPEFRLRFSDLFNHRRIVSTSTPPMDRIRRSMSWILMGIFFSASLEEEVLAFESAALRDEWVSKLTVRVCMLCARPSFHSIPLHNAQSFHVAFSYPRPSVGAGHSSCGGCSAHGAAASPGHVLLASHAAVADAILLQNFSMHPAVLQKKVRVVLPRF